MQELFDILPTSLVKSISSLSMDKLMEVRLRRSGVSINYCGKFRRLNVSVSAKEIEDVIVKAAKNSVYAYNDMIKNGYISLEHGIRIGVCGEVVPGKTIKNFTSLNIRIPHEVKNCASAVFEEIVNNGRVKSTLIISPPGFGKTTFLRDLVRLVSDCGFNVLVCDQRYELSGDLGKNTDSMRGADKEFAFSRAVRYMRPDVIACDELTEEEDFVSVEKDIDGGVKVLCTMHGERMTKKIRGMEKIVQLSSTSVGKVERIYDA